MAEYKGNNLAVWFNTIDLSGQARTVNVSEEAGDPDQIDVTHKGDAAKVVLEGLPGSPKTTVDLETLDAAVDTAGILQFAINAKDTLFIYPQGKTHTMPMMTIQNARMTTRAKKVPYDGAAELTAKFVAENTITWSTYTSVV